MLASRELILRLDAPCWRFDLGLRHQRTWKHQKHWAGVWESLRLRVVLTTPASGNREFSLTAALRTSGLPRGTPEYSRSDSYYVAWLSRGDKSLSWSVVSGCARFTDGGRCRAGAISIQASASLLGPLLPGRDLVSHPRWSDDESCGTNIMRLRSLHVILSNKIIPRLRRDFGISQVHLYWTKAEPGPVTDVNCGASVTTQSAREINFENIAHYLNGCKALEPPNSADAHKHYP